MALKKERFTLKVILVAILLIGAYGYLTYTEKAPVRPETQANTGVFTVPVSVSFISDTGFLKLVNAELPVTDKAAGAFVSAWPEVPVGALDVTLDKTALAAAQKLFSAAKAANAGDFYVSSGYRGYEEQEQIYKTSADKSFVQPAGHSEHETGLAADIMAKGVSQQAMGASAEGKWLEENAWKYGFILRYPADKKAVTGISYEPWHFRYVGQPHAWYCMENNLCYEEYIRFLQTKGGYSAPIGGTRYSVMYETPKNGAIFVPNGQNYSVSADNTGGYIVTAWK